MKRLAVIFGFLLLIAAGNSFADIFTCMDCSERTVKDPDGTHTEASCCMAQGGHCYSFDSIVDWDVGSGCRVSEADEWRNTNCISDRSFDPNCGQGGTGNKTSTATVIGDQTCVTDQYGWCDISCMNCTSG